MPHRRSSKKSNNNAKIAGVAVCLILVLVAIIAVPRYLPQFALNGYGIPGVSVETFTETAPQTQTYYIHGSYGSVTTLNYISPVEKAAWTWAFGTAQDYVELQLYVTLKVNIQTTDLLSPQYETQIQTPTYLTSSTSATSTFTNKTIYVYGYGFKIETQWSGSANVNVIKTQHGGILDSDPYSVNQLTQMAVQKAIEDFNTQYLTSADILLSINAPALAGNTEDALNPDYLGLMAMWLSDYQMAGYTPGGSANGVGCQGLPNTPDTSVQLYSDALLTHECWAPSYSTGQVSLAPTEAYYLNEFAPGSAYFQVQIVSLGSQLVYDASKPGPNYFGWAFAENGATTAPVFDQWFRVDLGFDVKHVWSIPNNSLPQGEIDKLKLSPPTNPNNPGTPTGTGSNNLPLSSYLAIIILLAAVGGIAVVMIAYASSKKKNNLSPAKPRPR